MDRVYLSNVSQTPPDLSGYQSGFPQPATSSASATVPGPYVYHMLIEEQREVIVVAGLVPDAGDLTQVAQAVVLLATKAGQSASATYSAQIETASANAASAVATANSASSLVTAIPTALANTSDNTQGAALVVAPYGVSYQVPGTVGNRLMGQGYTPEEAGAIGNTPSHDDGPALQAAIDYCLANGINHLVSTRNFYTAQPLYISNFTFAFEMHLGGLKAHANFPAIPTRVDAFGRTVSDWKNAQSLIVGGAVGGSQVGVKIYVGFIDGSNNANGYFDTENGMGGCEHYFGRAENCVRVVKHLGNTSPTASNRYRGMYWQNNLQAAYIEGSGGVNEGTMFEVGFISQNKYGGIVVGDKGQYFNPSGSQLDFNGKWVTRFQVSSLAGFSIGDSLSNGSGSYGELLAAYVDCGINFFLVIETQETVNGATLFASGNNFTNGTATTTILNIDTTNQAADALYWDIINASLSSAPFQRFTAITPYLGGIVGNQVWSGTVISGNSAQGNTTWINGVGFTNGGPGGNVTLYNRADNTGSYPFLTSTKGNGAGSGLTALGYRTYTGNNQDFGVEASQVVASGATVAMATFINNSPDGSGGASTHGGMWEFRLMDEDTSGIYAKGSVRCNLTGSSSELLVDTATNCAVTLSGLTLSVSQGTGASRTIYLVYKRVM